MNKLEIKHKRTNEIIMTIEYKNSISEADLSWADLSDANLRGADLSDANLSDANLSGADLSGADLYGANLRGAYLSWTNLREANLRGAYLSLADLSDANLSDANLSGANIYGANLRGANLSGADLSWTNLSGANLREADLREAKNINYDNLIGSNIYNVKINTDDIFIEILGYKYTAYIFKNYMKIGSKSFSHSEWLRFWKVKKLESGETFNEYFSTEQLEMIYTCVKKQNDKLKKVIASE